MQDNELSMIDKLRNILTGLQNEFVKVDIKKKKDIQQKIFLIVSLLSKNIPVNLNNAQKKLSHIIVNKSGPERMNELKKNNSIVKKLISYGKKIIQVNETCDIIKDDIFKRYLDNECPLKEKRTLERHLIICDKCLKRLTYCSEITLRKKEHEALEKNIILEIKKQKVTVIEKLKDFFKNAHIYPHYLKSETVFSSKTKSRHVGIWPLSFKLREDDKVIEVIFQIKGEYLYGRLQEMRGLKGHIISLKYNDKEIVLSKQDKKIIEKKALGFTLENIDEIKKIFFNKFNLIIG